MIHIARITQTDGVKPFHVQCTCPTAGDFATENDAIAWAEMHGRRRSGIETFTLLNLVEHSAPEPEPEPEPEREPEPEPTENLGDA